jgi:hypothetical protein
MKKFIAIVLGVLALSIITIRISKNISLKQNCTGYLKRAADANTVETAKEELQKSIKYLEANNLTKGYTSILWQTPDEDIEFWYKNLKASENELMKVDSTTTSVEKTNLLMKLRETLLDNGEKGDCLTVPSGLSRYPNNEIWCVLTLLAILIIIGLIIYGKVSIF